MDRIAETGVDANVSIKLTQMGLDLGDEICVANVSKVLERARKHDIFVRLDMEGSPYVERTLKLFAERLCRHYTEDYGLETRVVRFHNIFGPLGTFDGGREKSPAAFCRKIAMAADNDSIEVWGDGKQTRSYCYIDDCVEGICRLMRSSTCPGESQVSHWARNAAWILEARMEAGMPLPLTSAMMMPSFPSCRSIMS